MIGKKTYKIACNIAKRTYTIRVYEKGRIIAKYRSFRQSKTEFTEYWSEHDIYQFLRYSNDYYIVKLW